MESDYEKGSLGSVLDNDAVQLSAGGFTGAGGGHFLCG